MIDIDRTYIHMYIYVWINKCMDRQMDEWIEGKVDRW